MKAVFKENKRFIFIVVVTVLSVALFADLKYKGLFFQSINRLKKRLIAEGK